MYENLVWDKYFNLETGETYLEQKNQIIEKIMSLPEYNKAETHFNRINITVKEKIHIPEDKIKINKDGTITSTDRETIEKPDAQTVSSYPYEITIITARTEFIIDLKDKIYEIKSRGLDKKLSEKIFKDLDGTAISYTIETDTKIINILSKKLNFLAKNEYKRDNRFYE
ncbi:MAG: hypothetical protein KAJ54_03020 [Candidatus Aenigmarchaeota archaeon]|nr:hypothetical protein [Candidatus Aenigmarchaeota archaeon]